MTTRSPPSTAFGSDEETQPSHTRQRHLNAISTASSTHASKEDPMPLPFEHRTVLAALGSRKNFPRFARAPLHSIPNPPKDRADTHRCTWKPERGFLQLPRPPRNGPLSSAGSRALRHLPDSTPPSRRTKARGPMGRSPIPGGVRESIPQVHPLILPSIDRVSRGPTVFAIHRSSMVCMEWGRWKNPSSERCSIPNESLPPLRIRVGSRSYFSRSNREGLGFPRERLLRESQGGSEGWWDPSQEGHHEHEVRGPRVRGRSDRYEREELARVFEKGDAFSLSFSRSVRSEKR